MSRLVLRVVGLVLTGLFAGFLLGILVFELSLRGFDGRVYAQTQQVTLIALPGLATALLIPAVLATAASAALDARSRDRASWSTVTALVLLLLAFVVTLTINVPINLAEGGWVPSAPPRDWAGLRDRWQIGHAVRTVTAVLAFVSLAVARSGGRPPVGGAR